MKEVNLVIVFNMDCTKVLMCERKKDPYKGQLNFVGGKKTEHETDLEAAYRELYEETNISNEDIVLHPLYKTIYYQDDLELMIYVGVLDHEVNLIEELNPLIWIDSRTDFFDSRFAGNGNIAHMMANISYHAKTLLLNKTK